MIHTAYDRTFLPEFSRKVAEEFRSRKLQAEIRCLPCGHYTLGETPYKYMDGYLVTRFVAGAFNRAYSNDESHRSRIPANHLIAGKPAQVPHICRSWQMWGS